jgi:clan AA aspartic protease
MMLRGSVTSALEAVISLEVRGPLGDQESVQALIDTGFDGFLTLPRQVIARLFLPTRGHRPVILADGSQISVRVYRATVLWDGQARAILVLAAEGPVLAGMSLLHRYLLTIEVADGGLVTIAMLP